MYDLYPLTLFYFKLCPLCLSLVVCLWFNLSSSTELGQEAVPVSSHSATAGVMPYLQTRASAGDQNSHSLSTTPAVSTATSSSSGSGDRQPAPPGTMVSLQLPGQSFSLGISNSGIGPSSANAPGGVYTSAGQYYSLEGGPLATMVSTAYRHCNYLPK